MHSDAAPIETMLAPSGRSIAWRGREYPVVLPKLSDSRLHTAGVVMTIHVLGQVTLGFAVSVPQILAAILVPAISEVIITAFRHSRLQWPASAMLTGSGIGLILRVEGTTVGDHWTFHRWYVFAGVGGASLATKYLIRWRNSHVFNPSNVGLVAAFVLLGAERVEPLDLHWASFGPGMLIAYLVILGGGLAITSRLRLIELAAAFWLTLVVGLGALAWSGHCMITPWSLTPVCNGRFWWTFAVSPEVLIYLFFMITDPKTVPSGRLARLCFGVAIGVVAVLMIAPRSTEFGAKVGLLAALTIVTIGWRLASTEYFSRWIACLDRLVGRLAGSAARAADAKGAALGLAAPLAVVAFLGGTVVLGSSTRTAAVRPIAAVELPNLEAILVWSAPATLPSITADDRVTALGDELSTSEARTDAVLGMLHALAAEAEILRRREPDLLAAVDHGARLAELTDSLQTAIERGGSLMIAEYSFESAHLTAVTRGRQSGPVLAVQAIGTVSEHAITAAGVASTPSVRPVGLEVAMRRASDGRWLVVDLRRTDGP